VLTLDASAAPQRALRGVVRLGDGRPAPAAYVSTGAASVRTGNDGAFLLELDEKSTPERVRAVLGGYLPAELALGADEARWNELVLVLGEPARAIEGRVLDRDGKPVACAQVWTEDGEPFGEVVTRVGELDFQLTTDVETILSGSDLKSKDGRHA